MMQPMFVIQPKKCLVLVTVLATASATAGNTCSLAADKMLWRTVFHDEILTLYEPVNFSDPPELAARIRWPATAEALYKLVWDYAHFREHIPNVRKSKVLHRDDKYKWVYQQLELPWPLQDRHYVMESTNIGSRPDEHDYQLEWWLSERFPLPAAAMLQPEIFSGCWHIRGGKEGGLNGLYRITLDPGGNVPTWMTRSGMHQYVKRLMNRLHELLQPPGDSSVR